MKSFSFFLFLSLCFVALAFVASVDAVSPKLHRLSEQSAALEPKSLLSSHSSVSAPRPRPAWCNTWVNDLRLHALFTPNLNNLRQAHPGGVAGATAYIPPSPQRRVVMHGFTYQLDVLGRVTEVSGNINPAGIGSSTVQAAELMDCMFEGDRGVLRDSAVVGAGQTAGHIVSPSLGGHTDFNTNAINFFPQSTASNGGVYNTREQTAQGVINALRFTHVGCTPSIHISLTYPPVEAPFNNYFPSIPTGGQYTITIPQATCGGNKAALLVLVNNYEAWWRLPAQNANVGKGNAISWANQVKILLNAATTLDAGASVVSTLAWVNP